MVPNHLRSLFWDIDLETFLPEKYPDYTISRVLELGDEAAVQWLRQNFPDSDIRHVLKTERRLTPKSANFWALVYDIPAGQIAALSSER